MHPIPSRTTQLLAVGLLLGAVACASDGLAIRTPTREAPAGPTAVTVRIASVRDARSFATQSNLAPIPSTQRDVDDAAYTRRVIGRRRVSENVLGGDRFTADPGGVPALVRGALEAGLIGAGFDVVPEDEAAPETARLDAVVESFWIHEAIRSASARLVYRAEVRVEGSLPGLAAPVHLDASGSIGSGAADGVLWRRTAERALDELATALQQRLTPRPSASRGSTERPAPVRDAARAAKHAEAEVRAPPAQPRRGQSVWTNSPGASTRS